MTTDSTHPAPEQGILQTLQSDVRRGDFWSTLSRDMRELREFFLDEERKKRLATMSTFGRAIWTAWWMLKGMILRLTPARRILLVVGVILVLAERSVTVEGSSTVTAHYGVLGGLLLVFVLMLELKDKILARDELEAGRRVQHAFMPPRAPQVPGWALWLYTRPANEVGGDLVDFVSVHDERRMIILADVAGKGLKAALLMANLQATMRALAPDYASLAYLVGKVNEIFRRNTLPNVFASLLAVEFSTPTGEVHYVNAGHFPPLLLRPEGIEQTPKGEAALGLMPGSVYSDQTVKLRPGEAFLGYSDGLTEARNGSGEFYGSERLLQLLATNRNRNAEEIGEAIIADVARFVGDANANDDVSIIILRRV